MEFAGHLEPWVMYDPGKASHQQINGHFHRLWTESWHVLTGWTGSHKVILSRAASLIFALQHIQGTYFKWVALTIHYFNGVCNANIYIYIYIYIYIERYFFNQFDRIPLPSRVKQHPITYSSISIAHALHSRCCIKRVGSGGLCPVSSP